MSTQSPFHPSAGHDPAASAVVTADVIARLRAAGCVFAEEEAAILLAAADGAQDGRRLEELVDARAAGQPLEYVVGWAGFAGLRLAVGPGAFVPRRRSEHLAALALDRARAAGPAPVVVELCCGAAPIAAHVAEHLDGADVHAADIDPGQTLWALRNLAPRGGHVHLGDLFDALPATLRGRVDVLAANAPYVPTGHIGTLPPEARDHEPRRSLDGGDDGVHLQRRITAEAATWLAPGGTLLIETSDGQTGLTVAAFRAGGFDPHVVEDPQLYATVVVGTIPATIPARD